MAVPRSMEDKFVEQYLVDRDARAAALRAGVARVSAKNQVRKWMRDPAVLAKIEAATHALDPNKMVAPQWIIAKFQEIISSPFSSASAKNTALKELATLNKMYPEKGKEDDDQVRGVVLVPADASLTNWEAAARKQQKALKADVR